ncbi:MAG: hypothetical protein MUF07_16750 [Steroidobacteraceae bacterium]|nr:hypothetical protein [Steroidobacteraceae bacterium]
MTLLAVKLLLVPLLVAAVTLAGRRWGQNLAGWLGSFPIVAGPILLILAVENGNAFGARAAQMALAGIAAAMVFYVAYARLAPRLGWAATLAASLATWAVAVAALQALPQTLPVAALLAAASLLASPRAMGTQPPPAAGFHPHPLELPARMAFGAGLTVATSALGARLGPEASGYAALFPIVGAVVASFNHATHEARAAGAFLAGMTRGMWSVGTFCLALTLALPRWPLAAAFVAAILGTVATHALMRPRGRQPAR